MNYIDFIGTDAIELMDSVMNDYPRRNSKTYPHGEQAGRQAKAETSE